MNGTIHSLTAVQCWNQISFNLHFQIHIWVPLQETALLRWSTWQIQINRKSLNFAMQLRCRKCASVRVFCVYFLCLLFWTVLVTATCFFGTLFTCMLNANCPGWFCQLHDVTNKPNECSISANFDEVWYILMHSDIPVHSTTHSVLCTQCQYSKLKNFLYQYTLAKKAAYQSVPERTRVYQIAPECMRVYQVEEGAQRGAAVGLAPWMWRTALLHQCSATPMLCYTNALLHDCSATPMLCYTNALLHHWHHDCAPGPPWWHWMLFWQLTATVMMINCGEVDS